MMNKIVLFIVFFLFLDSSCKSQNVISGKISDSAGIPISAVTITYRKINSGVIAGFALSDKNGDFKIPITLTEDSITLSLSHLGYEKIDIQIKNARRNYKFILNEKPQSLPSVIVTGSPIYKRNDTVNYSVNAFTSKEDRVIGDVIKKLPGIEMEGDKILYQGKPIQRYFINGLDLLEGRYGLANNNLPVDAVGKIQIIENDQPVKILDSLIFSDRASLNIQLKKFTTTGTGTIGVGMSPFLRDVNLSPMTFNRNFQSLNTFQSNNIGDDVSQQLNSQGVGNIYEYPDLSDLSGNREVSFLNLQEIASPDFNEKKWLDNNINMVSSNFLQKLNSNLELKGSISYLNDFQRKQGQTYTTVFTPGENINLLEAVDNRYKLNDIRGNFILLKNEKNIYFKNNLKVSKKWTGDTGFLLRNNDEHIYQEKALKNVNVSNRFTAITFLGSQLITLNSLINFSETPQQLSITPGQFENVLNDSIPYNIVSQDIRYNCFNTDNYISFAKGIRNFTLMPRIGVSVQNQGLESGISITENSEKRELGNNFRNQMRFQTTRVYIDLRSQYKNQKWRIDFNSPLMLLNYSVKDKVRDYDFPVKKLIFEPRILAIYQVNPYWVTSVSSGYTKQFGNLNTLYSAYLLTSYRNIQKFNSTVPESGNWTNEFDINYKNTMKAIFCGFSYTYSLEKRNTLFKNILDVNGFNNIEMANRSNIQSFHTISTYYSKYLTHLKTVVKVKGGINLSKADYLFNEIIGKMTTNVYNASFALTNTVMKYLSLEYETRVTYIKSWLSGKRLNNIFMNNHLLEFNFFPVNNNTLSVNTEYYITNLKGDNENLFLDLKYTISIPKRKIDLELSCLNLLNNKTYVSIYNSEFSIVRNYFELRARQLLITTKFKF